VTGGRLRLGVLRVGDRVVFDGAEQQVVALSGNAVRLHSPSRPDQVVLLPHLLASPGARLVDAGGHPGPSLSGLGLLDGLPGEVVEAARAWERDVVELETGVAAGAPPGTTPRPQYDPARWSLAEREQAKAAELTAAGQPVGLRTVQRMRQRYHQQGLWGLVDQRAVRQASPTGRADPRLLAAITTAVEAETTTSTGTRGRLQRRVEQRLAAEHGPGVVAMPSQATFYRLVAVLSQGRHTFGQATTRRSLANRPPRPFTPMVAARPGELVLIDSTLLDVLAVFDDGVTGRAELTAAVDIATRTICAGVLRPVGTKAVDAALLLARMLVPEPMRPGWPEALRLTASRLPYQRLLSIDARLEQAAAKPVIVPETLVCDRGKVFLSQTFLSACQTLGISVQPAHPGTPTDKAVVERTLGSINSLFCQHVRGYVGANVTRRGSAVEAEAAWTVPELQELLEEWVIVGWQPRPHDGLRHPRMPGQALSPNEAHAVMVAASGYLPVPLSGEDYLELLPACWRQINDYGIRIDHRTYDCAELGPYRRQPSGVAARNDRWEVHYDPYDLTRVFVRNHHAGGWITVPWTHLPLVAQPFADFTWRQACRVVAARGDNPDDEAVVARALAELLRRVDAGPTAGLVTQQPDRRQQRIIARGQVATAMPLRPRALPAPVPDPESEGGALATTDDGQSPAATVIPFGVFDPFNEEDYR
jgi:transposase InsO family protein